MRVQFHSRPRVFNDYTGLAQSNERDDSPIPAAIPFFMLGLTELKISSRNPISDSFKKSAPETNTTPSATCQLLAKPAAVAAGIAEKTKKNFHPCPAPERSGNARTEP